LAHFRLRRLARLDWDLVVVDLYVRNDHLNYQDTPDLRCRFH
jgi:hypothetical protein